MESLSTCCSVSAQNGRDSNSQVGNIGKLDPQDFPALSQKHNSMAMGSLLGREYRKYIANGCQFVYSLVYETGSLS